MHRLARVNDILEALTGPEAVEAFERYARTGDDTAIRELQERVVVPGQGVEWDAVDVETWTDERLAVEQRRARELLSRHPPSSDESDD